MTGTGPTTGQTTQHGEGHGEEDGEEDGDCFRVDTAVLDEAVERVGRARDEVVEAGVGLGRLPVAGVAVGGDAVLDALCDLGRCWTARLEEAAGSAAEMLQALRAARLGYAAVEHAVLAAAGRPWSPLLLPGTEKWLDGHAADGHGNDGHAPAWTDPPR